jgi:hypothetical protein
MPKPDDESCENCRFWTQPDTYTGPELGSCHRYPISTVLRGERGKGNAQFPRIRPTGWCGEWKSVVTPAIIDELTEWTGNGSDDEMNKVRDAIKSLLQQNK